MDERKILELVASMRSHQKAYFRTASDEELQLSKDLERRVDKALEDYFNPSLFR